MCEIAYIGKRDRSRRRDRRGTAKCRTPAKGPSLVPSMCYSCVRWWGEEGSA